MVSINTNSNVVSYLSRRGIKLDDEAARILGQGFDLGEKAYPKGDLRVSDAEAGNFTNIIGDVLDKGATAYDLGGTRLLADNVISAAEARNLVARYHQDALFKAIKDKRVFDTIYLITYGGPERKGVPLTVKDELGNTPLMVAARSGSNDALGVFLSRGADIRARNINGETALMLAAQQGEVTAAALLLESLGANKSAQAEYANMTDSRLGSSALKMLLAYGDDSAQYETKASGLASMNKFIRMAMLLLSYGANPAETAAETQKIYDLFQRKKAAGEYFESFDNSGKANYAFVEAFFQMFPEYDSYVKSPDPRARLGNYLKSLNSRAVALLNQDKAEYRTSMATVDSYIQLMK